MNSDPVRTPIGAATGKERMDDAPALRAIGDSCVGSVRLPREHVVDHRRQRRIARKCKWADLRCIAARLRIRVRPPFSHGWAAIPSAFALSFASRLVC